MSYLLNGTIIRAPFNMEEDNSTQFAQQRTLSGSVGRDYFGSNKRVWILDYRNTNQADHTIIQNLYSTYLSTGTAMTWQVTEANYSVSLTNVHLDKVKRIFNKSGSDYISDFTLVLTEA